MSEVDPWGPCGSDEPYTPPKYENIDQEESFEFFCLFMAFALAICIAGYLEKTREEKPPPKSPPTIEIRL